MKRRVGRRLAPVALGLVLLAADAAALTGSAGSDVAIKPRKVALGAPLAMK